MASDWVVLNVGGMRIHTTRLTLTRLPNTLLAKMFEPDSAFSLARDETGAVLIDRDGRYFSVVLNYLRHDALIIDPGLSPLGVYEEARFFGIDALAAALAPAPDQPVPLSVLERKAVWTGHLGQEGEAPRDIKSLLALADGGLLSACADGRITLWHPSLAKMGQKGAQLIPVLEYSGHSGEVNSMALVPSIGRLFSASADHTVKIWATPPAVGSVDVFPISPAAAHRSLGYSSASQSDEEGESFSPVVSPTSSRRGSLRKLPQRFSEISLRSHTAGVSCLICDSGWCISGSSDHSICFWPWGAQDMQPASRMLHNAHQSPIQALCALSGLLVSAASDGTLGCCARTRARTSGFVTHAPRTHPVAPLLMRSPN